MIVVTSIFVDEGQLLPFCIREVSLGMPLIATHGSVLHATLKANDRLPTLMQTMLTIWKGGNILIFTLNHLNVTSQVLVKH